VIPTRALGAWRDRNGTTTFTVWAPAHERVLAHLDGRPAPVVLTPGPHGYHRLVVPDLSVGAKYRFELDGGDGLLPDPASRAQPEGVHGPSAVVDPRFPWTDTAFRPPAHTDLVLYELHVGTFTAAGTFDAVIPELDRLATLGVTAIELMPVAEFPGARNWGYDGVFPFAAHHAYGGADGLRRLVDAAHGRGLAVHLDVVCNHVGPEGNVLPRFGPYFTDSHRTPWGGAVRFTGPDSDPVRDYFVGAACWWARDCHVDGLRLDAVDAIVDSSARPFVAQLTREVRAAVNGQRRSVTVIAESAANDARLVRDEAVGGSGLDGVWSDDFHHALHARLTGERQAYYVDFGTLADLGDALRHGWTYRGRWSRFRRMTFGSPTDGVPPERFVVCAQNHDQVGNRPDGDRPSATLSAAALRLAAAAVVLAPATPLLFMGEEWATTSPFPYFTSHSDPALVEAVRVGRAREHGVAVGEDRFDPQAESTFTAGRPARHEGSDLMSAWYTALSAARRDLVPLGLLDRTRVAIVEHGTAGVITLAVGDAGGRAALVLLAFGPGGTIPLPRSGADGWRVGLDSGGRPWDARAAIALEVGEITVDAPRAIVLRAAP